MFDYKLIEALAMVVSEGGFDKAARRIHLTQSAVSQRVRLLEEQTGQILLVRTTPPRATSAGQRMIRHYLMVSQLENDLLATLPPGEREGFTLLPVGINGDSLATWFPAAVKDYLLREKVLLDLRSDDQEQTHRLLKNGEVIGCISAKERPIQGCRIARLGTMKYRMVAAPDFARRWFAHGYDRNAAEKAPMLIFNRRDELHLQYFIRAFDGPPARYPVHYLPSAEQFVTFISGGLACGMLPDQQSLPLLEKGHIVDLNPPCHVPVQLHWHCWNLKSLRLQSFSRHLMEKAGILLPQ